MTQWKKLQQRIGQKWQIPLFVISLVFLGLSLVQVRPRITDVDLSDSLSRMDEQTDAGAYELVFRLGQELLAVQEGYTERDYAAVRLRLARAWHDRAVRERQRTPDIGRQIDQAFVDAQAHQLGLSADDFSRWGGALAWMGMPSGSLAKLEQAIAGGASNLSALRKRVFELRDAQGDDPGALLALVDEFLSGLEPHRLDYRLWGIEQKIELMADTDQLELASTLLVREKSAFAGSDFEEGLQFLNALVHYRQGLIDEAETMLRAIRNRVDPTHEVYARTGWLLGQAVMKDDGPKRPYESISFFRDVLRAHAETPYGVASRLGLGEALSMLDRHDEALASFRTAIEDLPRVNNRRLVSSDVVRVSLGLRSHEQRDAGRLRAALAYAELAMELVDTSNTEQTIATLQQLNEARRMMAEELDSGLAGAVREAQSGGLRDEAIGLYRQAAEGKLQVATLAVLDERLAAESQWQAAELLGMAGDRRDASALYQKFVEDRPGHSLVARALLRIGQLRQADGDLEGAIEGFRHCYNEHKRTIDGLRALIPLAQCYLALGAGNEHLVEATLDVVLEHSDLFTPRAPEFADALFLYGEVLNHRGAYEDAIGRVEEALDRYPDDPRVWTARSLLADSYRQSALALKKEILEAGSAAEIEHIQAESTSRFERARQLYRSLIDEFSVYAPEAAGDLEAINLRHAYVYEADCLFEMARYEAALKLYEEAASLHKDTTTALAAYVQIINCYVFLGQPEEARSALARARILVDTIPDRAFRRSLSPEGRSDWARYFTWLEDAELF